MATAKHWIASTRSCRSHNKSRSCVLQWQWIFSFSKIFFLLVLLPLQDTFIFHTLFHLYTRTLPVPLRSMKVTVSIMVLILVLFIFRYIKKSSFIERSILPRNYLELFFHVVVWGVIYLEKFWFLYFICYYIIQARYTWTIFHFQIATTDINMFLLLIMKLLWIVFTVMVYKKRNKVMKLTEKIYRNQVANSFRINFPVTNLQRSQLIAGGENSKNVRKLISHLQVVNSVLRDKESLELQQFESVMTDFFQQIGIVQNDDIVIVALLLTKSNIKMKELCETLSSLRSTNASSVIPETKRPFQICENILKWSSYTNKPKLSNHELKVVRNLLREIQHEYWKTSRGHRQVSIETLIDEQKQFDSDLNKKLLENVDKSENYVFPICHHTFHQGCIEEWFHHKKGCPICTTVPEDLKMEKQGSVSGPRLTRSLIDLQSAYYDRYYGRHEVNNLYYYGSTQSPEDVKRRSASSSTLHGSSGSIGFKYDSGSGGHSGSW